MSEKIEEKNNLSAEINDVASEEKKTVLIVVKDGKETKKEVSKPTPEETKQFEQDFKNAMKAFDEKRWEISEPGKFGANDVGMYLLDYIKKFAFWSKTEWMGMIKMEEEINKSIMSADASIGLRFGYQALEFCAYMLANPGGTGIDLAKEFETQADKYSKIGIVVGTKIEEARNELKIIQYLQEKYAAAAQGFYLAELEPKTNEIDANTNKELIIENIANELKDHLDNLNSQIKSE
jgi:hypothetical protein